MAEEFTSKEKEEPTLNEQFLIQLIDNNELSEDINIKLEDLCEKMDTYNQHMTVKNWLLYIISIILFGILCTLFFI